MPAYKRGQTPLSQADTEKAAREARADADRGRLAMAYEAVFSTPDGNIVFEDLIRKSKFFQNSFTGNSQGMFFQGQQSIGKYLLEMRDLDSPGGFRNWLRGKVRR